MKKRMTGWIGVAMLAASPALGQVPAESLQGAPSQVGRIAKPLADEQAKDFGTPSFHTAIDSFAMTPWSNRFVMRRSSTTGLFCDVSSTESRAVGQVHLPHGVDIEALRVWGTDNSASDGLWVALQSSCLPDSAAAVPTLTFLAVVDSPDAGAPGLFTDAEFTAGALADNQSCTYQLVVRFGETAAVCDDDLFFYQARVQWKRFTPFPPVVATFVDVPVNAQFYREIEALADTGITAGCTATEFCPDEFVTRRQMAAFLARALGLQPPTIPDPANP